MPARTKAEHPLTDIARAVGSMDTRLDYIQRDLDAKHNENRTERDKIEKLVDECVARLAPLEHGMKQVLGDGTGETGMLIRIDRRQGEQGKQISTIEQDVYEIKRSLKDMKSEQKPIHNWVKQAAAIIAFIIGLASAGFMVGGAIHYFQAITASHK